MTDRDAMLHPTAWEMVQRARHPDRPRTRQYIRQLCSTFVELRGDRASADDPALVGGIGLTALGSVVVLGHQKGSTTREQARHRFGMPMPEGFRKAARLMRYAETFAMPLVCLIDTPGASPEAAAEERGQAHAIARCIMTLTRVTVPVVAVVIGEGCSGGALALGVANRLLMLEHAIFTVASPEACATILWRDAAQAPQAATALGLCASDLDTLGILDERIPEPAQGAHTAPEPTVAAVCATIERHLAELWHLPGETLRRQRHAKYRAISHHQDGVAQALDRSTSIAHRQLEQILAP